jgi:hypothetical protein
VVLLATAPPAGGRIVASPHGAVNSPILEMRLNLA